ncbi:serine threonine protein kinase [Diplodia corticola]|uniref:Serine threonine protein kinase n=1 Tax=Diplodia corticola TaxID=236234 RepID=A0A1J9RMJ1_9PEZI|nr:serine threonine protein kinase [Diplodia corticola]OJD28821.1 serine threonine protein kinase [Diplodia corticola]
MDTLIGRWNGMALDLKRYYEYQIEKRHPLRPDRYNSRITSSTSGPMTKRIVYMELEWLPHGDLYALIHHYYRHEIMVPEPFIWYVFLAMAKVAVICLNGQLSDEKDLEWERICHVDIKPDNIFLGAPNPNEPMEWARIYPVAQGCGLGYGVPHDSAVSGRSERPARVATEPVGLAR